MPRKTPSWWYRDRSVQAALLAPVAFLWDMAARLRWIVKRPYRAELPVICIGNFTAGGAGKTPTALAVARLLIQAGERPVFLTRGYGGTVAHPHVVDSKQDRAPDVGDEPLLLARVAPAVVSADRAAGARTAMECKAGVIVMDDGFQNPGLAKDLSLVVVDRTSGVGNGRVVPAGPLRAGLPFQLSRSDALVLIGEGSAADGVAEMARNSGVPILEADIAPREETGWLNEKPVIAFAGMAAPNKFFRMLETLGCDVVHHAAFPDHHPYTYADADELLHLAMHHRAQLVTTEKDLVRIEGAGSLERLRKAARALPVRLRFREQGKAKRILLRAANRRLESFPVRYNHSDRKRL